MAKSTPKAVGKVIRAQELMRQASDELTSARLETVERSGGAAGDDFRETPLDKKLNKLSGSLTTDAYQLDGAVRELAELIRLPEPEHG